MRVLDDSNCSTLRNGFGWQHMNFCYAGGYTAASDFGGAYQLDENGACGSPNPFTGACSCPAGNVATDVPIDGACFKRMHVVACVNTAAPRSTFAGTFGTTDAVYGCTAGNAFTGGCACAPGTGQQLLRDIYGPVNNCNANGQYGGHVGVCYVP